MVRSLSVLALVICCVGAVPTGQQPTQFRTGVELVQIDVSVLDRNRRPVRGLKGEDFTVIEDGQVHPVAAVAEIVIPDAEERRDAL